VFGFCHTLASNILFSVWPICHRVIVVANFYQSLVSYFFATLFVVATLLWLATLWLGKMWPGTKQALIWLGDAAVAIGGLRTSRRRSRRN
jgi:hypothetical protein